MTFASLNSIGLLGYMIIVDEEIHSNQIKWLNYLMNKYDLNCGMGIIKPILDGKDDISFNECLIAFYNESSEIKAIIYKFCYQLAAVDSENLSRPVFSQRENDILKMLEEKIRDIKPQIMRGQADKELRQHFDAGYNCINTFDFDLNKTLKIAKSDFNDYTNILGNIFSSCGILNSQLENKLNSIVSPIMKSAIESFLDEYNKSVMSILSDLKSSASGKELSAQSFSIALMGRTKAGKSTLHYIMCGEGEEFIGKGSQRTTRFNRVFNWNKIKIIDTPGIGAGEEDGKKDEEIAKRVISQADMICFVVIDDTTGGEVLELLDQIAEYHKPLLIVLNHKDNIDKISHLNEFLKSPDEWRLTTGESRLSGYINRIKRNAEKHNYATLLKIVPVFLLAARRGKEKNNNNMYNGSNYSEFVKSIQAMIEENCFIYKSKTMLDEPSVRLHKAYIELVNQGAKINALRDKIKKIRNSVETSLNSYKKEIITVTRRMISIEYDDFFTNKSYVYVEENYQERNVKKINDSFNKYLEEYQVKDHIKADLYDYIADYHKKISEKINEIGSELRYAKLNTDKLFSSGSISLEKNKGTFTLNGVFKITSLALDIASIIFPMLAVIAVPISIGSIFTKSKKKKIESAKNLTMENFRRLTEYSEEQSQKKAEENLENLFKDDRNEVTGFFNYLENQINEVELYISRCREQFEAGIKSMDKRFAYRILQYISFEECNWTIVDAERNLQNNEFTIKVKRPNINVDLNIKKSCNISSEKINIEFI